MRYYYKKGNLVAEKSSKLTTPISGRVALFIQALVDTDPEGRPNVVEAASDVWLEELGVDNHRGTDFQFVDEKEVRDCASLIPPDNSQNLKGIRSLVLIDPTGLSTPHSPLASLYSRNCVAGSSRVSRQDEGMDRMGLRTVFPEPAGMFAGFNISDFLDESYPISAPFNGEVFWPSKPAG
ncbi:hypothetical protein HOY82DRAFT_494679 [Tuber indicum]|nr:hypothetical protein HOY82DRAFT_494679 [Tuber indicum]